MPDLLRSHRCAFAHTRGDTTFVFLYSGLPTCGSVRGPNCCPPMSVGGSSMTTSDGLSWPWDSESSTCYTYWRQPPSSVAINEFSASGYCCVSSYCVRCSLGPSKTPNLDTRLNATPPSSSSPQTCGDNGELQASSPNQLASATSISPRDQLRRLQFDPNQASRHAIFVALKFVKF